MKKTNLNTTSYPAFEHSADTLKRYIEAAGIFTILLKDGTITHYFPENVIEFRSWLEKHNIQDVRASDAGPF